MELRFYSNSGLDDRYHDNQIINTTGRLSIYTFIIKSKERTGYIGVLRVSSYWYLLQTGEVFCLFPYLQEFDSSHASSALLFQYLQVSLQREAFSDLIQRALGYADFYMINFFFCGTGA
jgi:hypothetical protein